MEAWEKQTLLTEAAAAGDADRVQRLLDEGSNVDETGRLGETALMQAAELGHDGVLKVLIACGADLEFKKKGRTALMMAAYTGQTGAVKLLLEAGARINHETDGGDTALTMAYRGDRPETVLFLLDRCTPLGAYSGTAENLREWALKKLDERTKKQRPRRIEDFSL